MPSAVDSAVSFLLVFVGFESLQLLAQQPLHVYALDVRDIVAAPLLTESRDDQILLGLTARANLLARCADVFQESADSRAPQVLPFAPV